MTQSMELSMPLIALRDVRERREELFDELRGASDASEIDAALAELIAVMAKQAAAYEAISFMSPENPDRRAALALLNSDTSLIG